MGNDPGLRRLAALGLALVLSGIGTGCATAPWPFNAREAVFRAPEPPQILSANSTTRNLPPCPQGLIAQAQWLARNMARVRLGYNKLQVVSLLGDPAQAETFSLTNGAAVEVLFYHTPETICRVNGQGNVVENGMMPLVFQDDHLLGYGPNYYRGFIAPMMRPMVTQGSVGANGGDPMGLPQARVTLSAGPDLRAAPARTGRYMQEDLPAAPTAAPATIYAPPPVARGGNGYTATMQQDMRPAGYSTQDNDGSSTVGRGAPLQ